MKLESERGKVEMKRKLEIETRNAEISSKWGNAPRCFISEFRVPSSHFWRALTCVNLLHRPLRVFGEDAVGVVGGDVESGQIIGGANVTENDGGVAFEAREFEAREGRSLGVGAKIVLIPREHGTQVGVFARGERGFAGGGGPAIPRADIEAIIAAEETIADGGAKFFGNRAMMLDKQIGEAPAGIELVGRGNGAGRANINTRGAGAAMVAARCVGREFEGGGDDTEEQPGAEPGVDQQSIFALPTEPGLRGEGLFQNGAGVHIGAALAPVFACEGSEAAQALEQEIVVIAPERVFGDAIAAGRLGLIIIHTHKYQTTGERRARGGGEQLGRGKAAVVIALEPTHAAVLALGEPLLEIFAPQW